MKVKGQSLEAVCNVIDTFLYRLNASLSAPHDYFCIISQNLMKPPYFVFRAKATSPSITTTTVYVITKLRPNRKSASFPKLALLNFMVEAGES